jgi:glutathione S-transferase
MGGSTITIQFFDLEGLDGKRFSPFGWRVRMALAHKGLESTSVVEGVGFSQKDKLEFSSQGLVPVIRDDDMIISDSWDIAVYLEKSYESPTSLFGTSNDFNQVKFISSWVDSQLHPLIARCVVRDILNVISPSEHEYFRTSREKRFGKSLEEVVAGRENTRTTLQQALYPIRKVLEIGSFLGGDNPNFSDYAIFGAFMWARVTSAFPLLELSDPIYNWRERMLLLYDGLAKNAPAVDI